MKKGVTLVELVIAVGILSFVIVPLFTLFVTGTQIRLAAERVRSANYQAQLELESLIGRPWVGDLRDGPEGPGGPSWEHASGDIDNFRIDPSYAPGDPGNPNKLTAERTVSAGGSAGGTFTVQYELSWRQWDGAGDYREWPYVLLDARVRVQHSGAPEWSRWLRGTINVAAGGFR